MADDEEGMPMSKIVTIIFIILSFIALLAMLVFVVIWPMMQQ